MKNNYNYNTTYINETTRQDVLFYVIGRSIKLQKIELLIQNTSVLNQTTNAIMQNLIRPCINKQRSLGRKKGPPINSKNISLMQCTRPRIIWYFVVIILDFLPIWLLQKSLRLLMTTIGSPSFWLLGRPYSFF